MKILDTFREYQLSEDAHGNFTVATACFTYVTRDYEAAIEYFIKKKRGGKEIMLIRKEIRPSDCPPALRRAIERNIKIQGEKLFLIEKIHEKDGIDEYIEYVAYFDWENHVTILTHDTAENTYKFTYLRIDDLHKIIKHSAHFLRGEIDGQIR